jgi:hypothetical protein
MDTKEKEFIVIARCMLSKFQDVQVVKAADKDAARETWAKMNSLVGISVDARYTDKVEIMTETEFDKVRTQIRMANSGISMSLNMPAKSTDVVPVNNLTGKDLQEYKQALQDEIDQNKFAKANNVDVSQIYYDDNDNLRVSLTTEPPF